MICPNRNTQEYKDLLEEVGGNEAAADISWFLKYGFEEEAGTLQADQIMAERAEAEMEESWLAGSKEKEGKLQKVAKKYGMNKKGFFDNTVMPGKVKSDLYDEGLSEEVGVKTTSTQDGSYLYDKSTGRKISPPFSFYSLESEETTEALIDESLEKTLNSFLSSIGVKVEVVDEIRTKHGLSARAVADITNRVVRMAKGQSDVRDLSEEAAHFLIALSRGTDLYNRLVEAVKKTPEYQSVLEDEGYTEAYANNNSALVEEAIAKVLKQILLNTSPTSNRAKVKSLFQEILDFVAGLFGFKEYFNTEASTERSVFEEAANIILNKEQPVVATLEITFTDEEGNSCAAYGAKSSKFTRGSTWEIVKDLKGYPSHAQGGVDISLGKDGFSFSRGGSKIKASCGLVLSTIVNKNMK